MQKLTKIEAQKRNKKRYNIYINNNYTCSLSEDTLLKYNLKEDDEISEEILHDIKKFDEFIYSKKLSFDLLSYRIRSEKEIRTKLMSKKISSDIIEKTIKHLNKLGLINDYEFALQLATEKIKNKFLSKRALIKKLSEMGISKDTTGEIIDKLFNPLKEKQLAMEVYKKLKSKLKDLDTLKKKKKTYETLMRKGFDREIIQEIIRENFTANSN